MLGTSINDLCILPYVMVMTSNDKILNIIKEDTNGIGVSGGTKYQEMKLRVGIVVQQVNQPLGTPGSPMQLLVFLDTTVLTQLPVMAA